MIFYINLLLIFLALIFYFLPINANIYANETSTQFFFQCGLIAVTILSVWDIFYKRKKLFSNTSDNFRWGITLLAALIVCLQPYAKKTALGVSIALAALIIIYGIYKRTFHPLHPIMLGIVAHTLIVIISTLWSNDFFAAIEHIDFYFLFLLLPIISIFYKVEKKEVWAFIYIPFVVMFNLMTLSIIAYIQLVKFHQKPLFSLFSLSKQYLDNVSYYHTFQWSITNHPSFITWTFLLVGTMGFWLWQQRKECENILSTKKIILYWIFLALTSLMFQARVNIVGIPLLLFLFIWIFFLQRVKNIYNLIIPSLAIALIGLFLFFWASEKQYFNDISRINMNKAALAYFQDNLLFGCGADCERGLVKSLGNNFNKLHNSFLSTMVNQGLIGLLSLLFFHILIIFHGIKEKHLLGIYTLGAFTIFNHTEDVMAYPICISVFLFTMLPLKKENNAIFPQQQQNKQLK